MQTKSIIEELKDVTLDILYDNLAICKTDKAKDFIEKKREERKKRDNVLRNVN